MRQFAERILEMTWKKSSAGQLAFATVFWGYAGAPVVRITWTCCCCLVPSVQLDWLMSDFNLTPVSHILPPYMDFQSFVTYSGFLSLMYKWQEEWRPSSVSKQETNDQGLVGLYAELTNGHTWREVVVRWGGGHAVHCGDCWLWTALWWMMTACCIITSMSHNKGRHVWSLFNVDS